MVPFNLQSDGIIAYIKDTYQEKNELTLYARVGIVDNQLIVMIQQHIPRLKTWNIVIPVAYSH